MVLLYMVTFTINIPQMLAYIPYMDPMGIVIPTKMARSQRVPRFEFLNDPSPLQLFVDGRVRFQLTHPFKVLLRLAARFVKWDDLPSGYVNIAMENPL